MTTRPVRVPKKDIPQEAFRMAKGRVGFLCGHLLSEVPLRELLASAYLQGIADTVTTIEKSRILYLVDVPEGSKSQS